MQRNREKPGKLNRQIQAAGQKKLRKKGGHIGACSIIFRNEDVV